MHKKLYIYLLLILAVVGSIALASAGGESLQGAFNFSTQKTPGTGAILHVKARNLSPKESLVNWDTTPVTLGEWLLTADQNLSINGLSYHVGIPTDIGSSTDYVGTFFENCRLTMTESGVELENIPSNACVNAYNDLNLKAGKTYTLTLTGTALGTESAYDTFLSAYDYKEVALSFLGLTDSNGKKSVYTDASFPNLVDQKASTTAKIVTSSYSLEYTFGGYFLRNNLLKNKSSNEFKLSEEASSINIGSQTSYSSSKPNLDTISLNNLLHSIKLNLGSSSAITKAMTISISAGGSTVKISDGTSTKTCLSETAGEYSCDIP